VELLRLGHVAQGSAGVGRPAAWLVAAVALGGCLGGPRLDQAAVGEVRTSSFRAGLAEASNPAVGTSRASTELEGESDAGLDAADAATGAEPAVPVDDQQPLAAPPAAPPSGAADDSVRCGDGVLDDNELCDVAIEAGLPGACPTSCASDPCHPQQLKAQACFSRCVAGASTC
jgi:hypothetical protein